MHCKTKIDCGLSLILSKMFKIVKNHLRMSKLNAVMSLLEEMLMYMLIIFEMQMIHTYHVDDLISEILVPKLPEQICGILFHRLLKLPISSNL